MAKIGIGVSCGLRALDNLEQVLVNQTTQINSGKINLKDFRNVKGVLLTMIVEEPVNDTLLVVKYTLSVEGKNYQEYQEIKTFPMKKGKSVYNLSPIIFDRLYDPYSQISQAPKWVLKVSATILRSSVFLRIDNSRRSDYLNSLLYSEIESFSWDVWDKDRSDVDESGDFINPIRESGRALSADEV